MNDPKPIAGRAKLNEGECRWRVCFGDELDDVGDEADEYEVAVSVEPLSNWEEEDEDGDRSFSVANRAAAVTGGRTGLGFDGMDGEGGT